MHDSVAERGDLEDSFLHMAVREQRVPVIHDGEVDIKRFNQDDVVLDPTRLVADLRSQGVYDLDEVEFAQIEPNGTMTVIRKGDGVPNFTLVVKGNMVTSDIEDAHKSVDWVKKQIRFAKVELEDIFLLEFKRGNRLLFLLNDGTRIRRDVMDTENMNDKEHEWKAGIEKSDKQQERNFEDKDKVTDAQEAR